MRKILLVAAVTAGICTTSLFAGSAELRPADVVSVNGDGPDGKGNTKDDTWQFWFQLVRSVEYRRLDIATATMTADQRQNGIRDKTARKGHQGKVQGPIGQWMPKGSEGWIYHSDWDGRGEGVWGNEAEKSVLAHPYNEKTDGGAVAVTYTVPEDGKYDISVQVTDKAVVESLTGISMIVDVVELKGNDATGAALQVLGNEKVGDKVGPPTKALSLKAVVLKKGQLVRLVIDPNKNWGADLTQIDCFKIEKN